MTTEYSSLHREPPLHLELGGQPGCWRTGRGVKTISSHIATVLITLLVVTVLLLSMEIAGRDNPGLQTVQQVTPVSQWDAGSEFLIDDVTSDVQLVNSSLADREKYKLEQKLNIAMTSASRSSCCSRLLISSTGLTRQWYPTILGVYSLQPGAGPPVYKMMESERFLFRPRRGKDRQFTWGVNTSPSLAWGWVKSSTPGKCPGLMKKWAAFDPVRKQMTADPTFKVTCRQP